MTGHGAWSISCRSARAVPGRGNETLRPSLKLAITAQHSITADYELAVPHASTSVDPMAASASPPGHTHLDCTDAVTSACR